MSEYWDIVQFKKGRSGKVSATKLGYAKKRDDGGFYLNFDALPICGEEVSVSVCPQREKGASPAKRELDDEIPF